MTPGASEKVFSLANVTFKSLIVILLKYNIKGTFHEDIKNYNKAGDFISLSKSLISDVFSLLLSSDVK